MVSLDMRDGKKNEGASVKVGGTTAKHVEKNSNAVTRSRT